MNRERTWHVGEMSVALLVSLGLGSWAWGQCSNDAGSGDLAEGEVCLVDEDEDTVNGGCNSSPTVFVTLSSADFAGGVVDICGSASNYLVTATCDTDIDCPDGDCQGDPNPGDGIAEGTCVGPSEPSLENRDTDWYLIPQSVLDDHDADANGVVQVTSEFVNAELDLVTFLVAVTDPDDDCQPFVLDDIGCWDTASPGDSNSASEVLVNAEHLDGLVVFVAPGTCSGGFISTGFECGTGNNDYILRITFGEPPTACQPGPPQGPCDEPGSAPGCEDPACCAMVCELVPICCLMPWNQACVDSAVDLGCFDDPPNEVLIATGGDSAADGYLRVKPDPYGALIWPTHSDGTPLGSDFYNPAGADLDAKMATASSTFYFFMNQSNRREMLNTYLSWQGALVPQDDSLEREVTVLNQASDTDGDLVDDQLVSQFRVFGDGVDLTFDLTQRVERAEGAVSTWTQSYVVTNNLAERIKFVLQRNIDTWLSWEDDYDNDSVGTGTNVHYYYDRYAYFLEKGIPRTAVTMSSPAGDAYGGAKKDINPDPDDPECPPYNWGSWDTDWQYFGMPDCWRNHIANVGYNLDGASGAGPGTDAHIALDIQVEILGGPGSTETVEIMYTYGQDFPANQEGQCLWDCQDAPNGSVDVADFLALLGQWGQVGTSCDFDGGGVSVTDFLEFLANFGPCP